MITAICSALRYSLYPMEAATDSSNMHTRSNAMSATCFSSMAPEAHLSRTRRASSRNVSKSSMMLDEGLVMRRRMRASIGWYRYRTDSVSTYVCCRGTTACPDDVEDDDVVEDAVLEVVVVVVVVVVVGDEAAALAEDEPGSADEVEVVEDEDLAAAAAADDGEEWLSISLGKAERRLSMRARVMSTNWRERRTTVVVVVVVHKERDMLAEVAFQKREQVRRKE